MQTSIVRATHLLTSVPQGANHLCWPSDLLSTTTTSSSKLIAYIVCVCLVAKTSFNLPPTVVLQQALSVRRARKQSPKVACPKMSMSIIIMTSLNIAYLISHVNTEFSNASWGGCQPWTHFQDSLVPRSFLINGLWRDLHICAHRAQIFPAPIALKIHVLFLEFFKHAQFHIAYASRHHSSVHGLVSRTTCIYLNSSGNAFPNQCQSFESSEPLPASSSDS
jgi:hypothetical protein